MTVIWLSFFSGIGLCSVIVFGPTIFIKNFQSLLFLLTFDECGLHVQNNECHTFIYLVIVNVTIWKPCQFCTSQYSLTSFVSLTFHMPVYSLPLALASFWKWHSHHTCSTLQAFSGLLAELALHTSWCLPATTTDTNVTNFVKKQFIWCGFNLYLQELSCCYHVGYYTVIWLATEIKEKVYREHICDFQFFNPFFQNRSHNQRLAVQYIICSLPVWLFFNNNAWRGKQEHWFSITHINDHLFQHRMEILVKR